jgi:hypothetical protein
VKPIEVDAKVGEKFGHLPGRHYHDVNIKIARMRSGRWQVTILEIWGSSQGDDEEHGRRTVAAQGQNLDEVVREASQRAEAAEIDRSYATQALSCAEAKAAKEAEIVDGEETSADRTKVTITAA